MNRRGEDARAEQGEVLRTAAEVSAESGVRSAESNSYKSLKGATAEELSTLADAKQLLAAGADSEEVRKRTGWFKGYDGQWRIEIDDSTARLIENPAFEIHETDDGDIYRTALLKDILENSALLDAYPELGDYTIIVQETEPGLQGATFRKFKQIVLSQELYQR